MNYIQKNISPYLYPPYLQYHKEYPHPQVGILDTVQADPQFRHTPIRQIFPRVLRRGFRHAFHPVLRHVHRHIIQR